MGEGHQAYLPIEKPTTIMNVYQGPCIIFAPRRRLLQHGRLVAPPIQIEIGGNGRHARHKADVRRRAQVHEHCFGA